MLSCRHRLIWLALLAPALFGPATIFACNVPVFRYALERWTPDPFVVVVFQGEHFTESEQAAVAAMQKAGRDHAANLVVRSISATGQIPAPFRALWESQQNPALPWMVVRYPAQTGIEPSVWTGPLSDEKVRTLMDSPARQQLGQRLLQGETAVWLLLESGEKQRDDALERTLKEESNKLTQTLRLPEAGPGDPETSPDPPLRIAFSTLRVARSDPAESLLVSQLLSWHPSLSKDTRAMLFPVFGRGRVLPPAIGEGIRPEAIDTMARLLTGPCSCQIKEMNAGFDLLMATDWDRLAQGREVKRTEGPPLVGMSRFATSPTNNPASLSARTTLALGLPGMTRQPAERDHLVRNLGVLVASAVLLVGLMTIFLRARSERMSG